MIEYDAFISYNHLEKDVVRQVANYLQSKYKRIWFDEHAILPGDEFPEKIQNGIEQSYIILVFIGDNGISEGYHYNEIKTAIYVRSRKKKETSIEVPIIIPVKLTSKNISELIRSVSGSAPNIADIKKIYHFLERLSPINLNKSSKLTESDMQNIYGWIDYHLVVKLRTIFKYLKLLNYNESREMLNNFIYFNPSSVKAGKQIIIGNKIGFYLHKYIIEGELCDSKLYNHVNIEFPSYDIPSLEDFIWELLPSQLTRPNSIEKHYLISTELQVDNSNDINQLNDLNVACEQCLEKIRKTLFQTEFSILFIIYVNTEEDFPFEIDSSDDVRYLNRNVCKEWFKSIGDKNLKREIVGIFNEYQLFKIIKAYNKTDEVCKFEIFIEKLCQKLCYGTSNSNFNTAKLEEVLKTFILMN